MNERDANALAVALNLKFDQKGAFSRNSPPNPDKPFAEAWQSGGGIWLVTFMNTRGNFVCISDEEICEYESEQAFEDGIYMQSVEIY